jgi:hypothetical protein
MEIWMNIIKLSDRREVFAASAAVAASRLIPTLAHAATAGDAIRRSKS